MTSTVGGNVFRPGRKSMVDICFFSHKVYTGDENSICMHLGYKYIYGVYFLCGYTHTCIYIGNCGVRVSTAARVMRSVLRFLTIGTLIRHIFQVVTLNPRHGRGGLLSLEITRVESPAWLRRLIKECSSGPFTKYRWCCNVNRRFDLCSEKFCKK